ncbi:MAG: VOC family protein [Candidatus Babeliales bacterium]
MNHVKKVGMLILMEVDIQKAIEFYQKLGLSLVFHLKGKWAEMRLGDVKIGLCPTEQVHEGHTGIVLEVEDLYASYDLLQQEGITFLNEPLEAAHGIMASIKDPSGNMIDLYQPTPDNVQKLVNEVAQEESCCGAEYDCCDSGCGDDQEDSDCSSDDCCGQA